MSKQGNWIEVQIRTEKMDVVAERGFMAYLKHRSDPNLAENSLEGWLNKVKNLIDSDSSSAIEFLNSFKLDLFNDEIFVFTPKGDIVCLPKNATVLDFAYAIHSEIGNRCIGANVNKKLATTDYVLNMGDQVDVITSEYHIPQEKYFDFLVTSLAKSRLKAGIKEYRKTFKDAGKQKLAEIFKKLNVEFSKQNRNYLVEKAKLSTRTDLYYLVATDKIKYQDVENYFKNDNTHGSANFLLKILTLGLAGNMHKDENNNKELGYTISTCCNPIPGDDVVAITFPNQPIQIHRPDCPKAINLMSQYGKNIVKGKWQLTENFSFMATLKISGVNKMGFGSDLFSVLSGKFKLDLYSIKMQSEGGMVDVTVSFYVNNLKQLEDIISETRKMNLVKKVVRIERNNDTN